MVQNLISSRGLSWPRSFGLGLSKPQLTFGRESVSINTLKTLSAASWSRERLLRVLWFLLYPRPWRLRGARCSGGKMTCCRRQAKILSKLHIIHMHPWNIAFKPLDWSLTNFSSRFPRKFRNSPTLILNEMLIWNEKEFKIWPFSRSKPIVSLFANYASHNKLRYHWTGLAVN